MSATFVPFPKIARLDSECTVTEKIDGTNACVVVTTDGDVLAQSRSRFITVTDDNYGFARWVAENAADLQNLGEGHHYGEWWGQGIQRRYDQDCKRFSLFNVSRWAEVRPNCCSVVPTLWQGPFLAAPFAEIEHNLRTYGSRAAADFMRPEGFMVYHHRLNTYIKHPFDKAAERAA